MKLVKRNQQFEKNPTLKSIYEKERHKIHKTVKFDRNFIKEIENLGYKVIIKIYKLNIFFINIHEKNKLI